MVRLRILPTFLYAVARRIVRPVGLGLDDNARSPTLGRVVNEYAS